MAGTITGRGAESWRLSWDVGRDEAGRRIRRTLTVRGSYKDAEKRLTELVSQRDQGIDVEPNKLTLDQFLAHWLKSHKVEPQSRARYQQLIRRHILPTLGATKLATLKPLHIQELLTLAEQKVSPSTAHDVFTLLNMAFAQGVRWQLLARNPADAVERPKGGTADTMRVLSHAEIGQLLSAGESDPLGPVVAFALATGVRRGEALALAWVNLDLDNGTAAILENARYEGGVGIVYGPTKTKKSRRTIALAVVPTSVIYRREAGGRLPIPVWGRAKL